VRRCTHRKVPTIAESIPGFAEGDFVGVFVPADTPPAALETLAAATAKARDAAEMRPRLETLGMEVLMLDRATIERRMAQDVERRAELVKARNLKLDRAISVWQRAGCLAQIGGETFDLGLTILIVRPQQRGWMHCRQHAGRQVGLHKLTALAADAKLGTEQRLRCSGAETDDNLGFYQFELRFHPRPAGADFHPARLLVDTPFTARFPFEVLHDVGDVGFLAFDAGFRKAAVEQSAGRSDKRASGKVFLIARGFADQHHRCVRGAFTEHCLRRVLVERTCGAVRRMMPQRDQRVMWRY
jgi:hypothetical protein